MIALAKFAPLKRKSQQVVENLLDGLCRGELEGGAKLPSERELAEAMADGIARKDETMALEAVHQHCRKYPSLQK